MVLHRFK